MSKGSSSIVLNYHDSLLRTSDVRLLNDGRWLNDNLIGFMLEYYEYDKYEKYSKELLFINPSMVQLLKFSDEEFVTSLIECWDWDNRKLIFIPLNNNSSSTNSGGSHWSLLVINIGESKCYSFDSSRDINIESSQSLLQIINKALISKGYKDLKFVEGQCPQQINFSDCGVYVICIVDDICGRYARDTTDLKYLRDIKPDIKPQHAAEQRKHIKQLIQQLSVKKT
ncbi:hypothetical protein HELRODRAFT_176744 [Helobdella robusta]|uniref:Ubiquitin-like protease family profile domain-containing protein n=1 Tax=Helobdella robusta TaxID=6412 RepID=T1FAV3_HELRO|nr:hypothetical protein HELRODRAFT_176744 [Helobdella robusta]ESN99575.1 hypothetical protein HELRODRAFT_176744 [Helobdella robusta]